MAHANAFALAPTLENPLRGPVEERVILFDSRFQIRFPLFLDSVSMIPYFRAAHMEDWESFGGQNHFGAVTIITANVRLFLVLVD